MAGTENGPRPEAVVVPNAAAPLGAAASSPSDSAGLPWAGRHFDRNAFSGDDGSANPELLRALARFQLAVPAGSVSQSIVVDAVRSSRLLIPLVATHAESGVAASGLTVDKSAELSIVTVAGPDGRNVLPVFSSVAAMARWNPTARPVPADAVRVGLAAASENTELIVLDPGSQTEFALRRPAVWAVAQQEPWVPSFDDPVVAEEFARIAESETLVLALVLTSGDPAAVLAAPELCVTLTLAPGLDDTELARLLARLTTQFSASESIAARVDSLQLRLRTANAS